MLANEFDVDEALQELRHLMHRYHDIAHEVGEHHNIEAAGHHLHELQAKLAHLKGVIEESGSEEQERKKRALERHAESVMHVLNHMHEVRRHMILHDFEAREQYEFIELLHELHKVYAELHHLTTQMRERKETQEYFKHHAHIPYAGPFPSLPH